MGGRLRNSTRGRAAATPLATPAQVASYTKLLAEAYPDAVVELDFKSPFELLVATILAAQSTDKTINTITPALFARYPTPAALAAADPAELEPLIFKSGFYRMKAKSLIGMARALVADHAGEVPRTLAELAKLPGVGRKTANVILGSAMGITEGVVVDTHVTRLAQRLGLTRETDPVKIEVDLIEDLAARGVDAVRASPDLARSPRVPREGAGLRALRARGEVPERVHRGHGERQARGQAQEVSAPVVAVGAFVFDARGHVLLIERGTPPGVGLWTVPGGKLEAGERLAAAVAREVREETGLEVEVGPLVEVFERPPFVILDYLARAIGGELRAASDVRAARFASDAELAQLPLTEGLLPVLARARAMHAAWSSTSRSP